MVSVFSLHLYLLYKLIKTMEMLDLDLYYLLSLLPRQLVLSWSRTNQPIREFNSVCCHIIESLSYFDECFKNQRPVVIQWKPHNWDKSRNIAHFLFVWLIYIGWVKSTHLIYLISQCYFLLQLCFLEVHNFHLITQPVVVGEYKEKYIKSPMS